MKDTVEVGALIRGAFRRFLVREKFMHEGPDKFEWEEVKGWTTSTFLIDAPASTLQLIYAMAEEVARKH